MFRRQSRQSDCHGCRWRLDWLRCIVWDYALCKPLADKTASPLGWNLSRLTDSWRYIRAPVNSTWREFPTTRTLIPGRRPAMSGSKWAVSAPSRTVDRSAELRRFGLHIVRTALDCQNTKRANVARIRTDKTQVLTTIPKSLPSGKYLIRVESIALHLAQGPGGAQFYISCGQLEVTGGGNGTPGPLVAFPGAYKSNDPGLIWPNSPPRTSYTAPGPAVWVG